MSLLRPKRPVVRWFLWSLLAIVPVFLVGVISNYDRNFPHPIGAQAPNKSTEYPQIPEVAKQDCQHLVEGELLFTPSITMKQGQPSMVSARLSRGSDAHITSGLDEETIIIQKTQVSCMVSMGLDSQESNAFKIENLPAGRKDEQVLLPNTFAQWDWRVTPLKHGTLHLLLYVTAILYVDGVGQGLRQLPQPPRVITVSPDYLFEIQYFVVANWAMCATLLTVIVVPLFLWLIRKSKALRERKPQKDTAGFAP